MVTGGEDAGRDSAAVGSDVVTLGNGVLRQYAAFTRFNSPYPAHDAGRAIDLYPTAGAPSPVAGEVVRTLSTRAPDRPYADAHDHLIVIDVGEYLARILHVDPEVGPGDSVAVGDSLGELVRSGYFAPWVDNHLHLGFRHRDVDPVRASGSLPVEADVEVEPVAWDGRGTVIERGDTYVVLDAPGHPVPGEGFAGIAADGGGVLDGGLPHYDGGGLVGGGPVDGVGGVDGVGSSLDGDGPDDGERAVALSGSKVGLATGETVEWDDVEIRANGVPVTGLSLACYRDRLGAKLVSWEGVPAEVGDEVTVEVRHR